jgi:hypothetical protein
MKFTLIVSALATLVAAAPAALEKKSFNFDNNQFNQFSGFNQVNLNYLFNVNQQQLQLQQLAQLAQVNNFNIGGFQNLFQAQDFDLNALLQFQQLQTLLQLQSTGIFNSFDFTGFQLQGLDFGLINNLNSVDLNQFIQPNVVTQVQTVASQILVLKE